MAGPGLGRWAGEEVSCPTWGWGAKTELWAENLEDGKEAQVTYQAGTAAGAVLKVAAGKGKQEKVEGDIHTLRVWVVNRNGTAVKVWTV